MRWMMAFCALAPFLATPAAAAQYWTRTWEIAMQGAAPGPSRLSNLHDRTLRQIVRISIGGDQWRLRLSNEKSPAALRLGDVHVALQDAHGAVVPGSGRTVRFAGQAQSTIAAHETLNSDPIALHLAPLSSVVISIYFPDGAQSVTFHGLASATGLLAPGDQAAVGVLQNPEIVHARAVIEAIDVESATAHSTIVTFGDSITDGARSTPDTNRRWPDLLANRLQNARLDVGVVNAGIGGNQILRDGAGTAGLARFNQDALAVPGVSHVVVLEGINDIGIPYAHKKPLPTTEALIQAYRQLIAQAHAKGVKIILATLLPFKGAKYWSAEGEQVRQALNAWIRTSGEADGVADFALALADPADPLTMRPELNSGDRLHPNDQGYQVMAGTLDLALLR
jgi:lysophospholipase L1-like esterase